MVIPQFSLRMALGLMALLGFVSLLISRGVQGSSWAMGVSIALAALVLAFAMYAAMFGLFFLASKAFYRNMARRAPEAAEGSGTAVSAREPLDRNVPLPTTGNLE